ncbi:hypothetical protein ACFUJR_17415 [Streptomyces sp. NPDC057271]|uniref:hypothetical protein n=1 Tax=unclassified Streptomyces TaxID=2593676 RepID=UPI003638FA4E
MPSTAGPSRSPVCPGGRVATQPGFSASTVAKTALTRAALAATAYPRMLGKKIEYASSGSRAE